MHPEWPSNENTVEIEKADGTVFTWRYNDPDPEKRPRIESYGTKFMEGYAEAVVSLSRKEAIGPDLGKYDTVRILDVYGKQVYEGRVNGFTEDTDRNRITVMCAGWMTHARDRSMTPVLYIDKDASHVQGPSQLRRENLDAANIPVQNDPEAQPNSAGGALRLVVRDFWETPLVPCCEGMYDAGPGQKVGRVYATFTGDSNTLFLLELAIYESDTPGVGTGEGSGDLFTAASGVITKDWTVPQRYLTFHWRYTGTPAGLDGLEFACSLYKLTIYGDHKLPRYGSEPAGLLVSDILKHSAGIFTPLLDTSEITATPHIVDQCREDDLQDPYDFWLKLNKYENRHLAVWDHRKLHFDAIDYEAVDWRVRDGKDGVVVKWTGPSTIADFNGIIVQYQSVETNRSEIVTPADDARLVDLDPTIAANEHGIPAYAEVKLSNPDSREGAIRTAHLILARLNRGKSPGTITVRGAIRDGAHHWHPLGHPKCAQTVLVENSGGAPRMIMETKVTDPETLTLTVDGKAESTDAILDELYTEANLRRNT
jgi:hypothetical protein